MKEIEEVCKKHGFDFQLIENGMLITKPKDIWEGVEFVYNLIKKKHQKVCGRNSVGLEICGGGTLSYRNAQESIESAYIEQLKKEAFERFGEINVFDVFEEPIDNPFENRMVVTGHGWGYIKDRDILYYENIFLYSQGKWATKVKERVKVEPIKCIATFGHDEPYIIKAEFEVVNIQKYNHENLPKFLASQLEAYLNGEIE